MIQLLSPPRGIRAICVRISDAAAPPADEAVERRWESLTAANPRLFDAPILALERLDLAAGMAFARVDSYKRLAVQPVIGTGVEQLSITGVLSARDSRGVEHILFGRRGPRTRLYGGMWEFAPSGGIDPPAPGGNDLSWQDLLHQLSGELAAETGLRAAPIDATFLAAVPDPSAHSTDLVIRARFDEPVERLEPVPGTWEYPCAAWIPRAQIPGFAADNPLIPPARALVSLFGES